MSAIIDFMTDNGYWGMLMAAFLAGSFFPFSSEAVMIALMVAGLEPWTLMVYGTVGNVMGSVVNYSVGRMGKTEWIERYLHVKKESLDRAERFMAGRGAWMGFFAFVPLLGSAITILLGLMRANVVISFFSITLGKVLRYVALIYGVGLFGVLFLITACSTTSHIPEDDQLFVGLTNITYENYEKNEHFLETQEEIEVALATAPNGALFGSSYYRSPFPVGLWVWNATTGSHGVLKKWLNKTFGKEPVLMSQVNPALHASVARSVLRKNGYMHGDVTYEELTQRNPRKAKVAYTVRLDTLFRIDSMEYVGFPPDMQHLIDSTAAEAYLYRGAPFSVGNLDAERTRLSQLFRNNGYYYYQPGYASFLADTFIVENRAQLRLQLADSLPENVLRRWRIGRMDMTVKRNMREQTDRMDSLPGMRLHYGGKKSPLSPSVVRRNMKMRPLSLFSYDSYQESIQKLNATNIFSSVDLQLTPRDTTTISRGGSTGRGGSYGSRWGNDGFLNQQLVCVLDKPYDFYVETNFINRTIGRLGPEVKVGVTKRNAFHGGERLDVNLHGSYEWETSSSAKDMNSYQYGIDASIEFPRTLFPRLKKRPAPDSLRQVGRFSPAPDSIRQTGRFPSPRNGRGGPRRFYSVPWTIAKVSSDVVRRPSYYKMHIVAGEWTYRWQPTQNSRHELSPLVLKYQFMNSHTERFDSLVLLNPYLLVSMDDYFIPKMRYVYTYTSPSTLQNPVRWETSIEEAGNLTALYDAVVQGNPWNQQEKTLFKNVYSQFLRLETDLTKTWRIGTKARLVGHVNAGIVYSYGNTDDAPFSEIFYAGGANGVRAFPVRSIGPGGFLGFDNQQFSYLMQNGDLKLVTNLELRFPLFGSLHGAAFIDAGNVWLRQSPRFDSDGTLEGDLGKAIIDILYADATFKPRNFFKQLATGTGFGLRYDLDFLVIRVDWGFGLHLPYDTGHGGYFNISRFRDMHTLHLAIGYPF